MTKQVLIVAPTDDRCITGFEFRPMPIMYLETPKGYPEPPEGYVWIQQWGFNCSGGSMPMHFPRPAMPGERAVPYGARSCMGGGGPMGGILTWTI